MKKILGLFSIVALTFAASAILADEPYLSSKLQQADCHVILITIDESPTSTSPRPSQKSSAFRSPTPKAAC